MSGLCPLYIHHRQGIVASFYIRFMSGFRPFYIQFISIDQQLDAWRSLRAGSSTFMSAFRPSYIQNLLKKFDVRWKWGGLGGGNALAEPLTCCNLVLFKRTQSGDQDGKECECCGN